MIYYYGVLLKVLWIIKDDLLMNQRSVLNEQLPSECHVLKLMCVRARQQQIPHNGRFPFAQFTTRPSPLHRIHHIFATFLKVVKTTKALHLARILHFQRTHLIEYAC